MSEGRDVVTEVDETRWSKDYYYHGDRQQVGRSYTWSAGVLNDIDRFDADFFGISPREATQMDPQQRLLLEMVWEALEDGAQIPDSLAKTDCGVYIGISGTDYADSRLDDPASGDAYTMTGGTLSIAANRISYMFDLCGPSMAIDTACSSSLVALHQACHSIWSAETSMALAGGIHLLLTPFSFIGFSRASMLSPRGRCRAFDAGADGYVRAEGGAVLFLKSLARAEADGDPIRAVIAASGVNSDGRTKGLSMPSSAAQEQLLLQVHRGAGLDPSDLVYLEAHGTGTAAGDPQEASAIGRALGQYRPSSKPLLIGSVKTNVGHLEPASGMAGVVKSILALEHSCIPKTLHFETPNPKIPFEELNLKVVSETMPLEPRESSNGLIGVNAFGFGGTNAHVVLRSYEKPPARSSRTRRKPAPLMLSARDEGALRELARRYADQLSGKEPANPYQLAYNAAKRRQQHAHRLVVWGSSSREIVAGLAAVVNECVAPKAVVGKTVSSRAPVALLFSGNGSQWPGMGRSLLKTDRAFRRRVEEFEEIFEPIAGFSIVARLKGAAESAELERTEIAQPALFALQAGLLATLSARGLRPGFVLGHSVGEVAAAYASGAFDLEQSVRLIYERSHAQSLTWGAGRMAAAGLPPDDILAAIDAVGGGIEIAAYNSARSVTVSGPLEALQSLGAILAEQEAFFRILDLEYAFHSRVMDPVHDGLVAALEQHGLHPSACSIPMISTVTGQVLSGEELVPEYWWQNMREPVRLDQALGTLLEGPCPVVVEVGPHPIMQAYLRESFRSTGKEGANLATLRRDGNDELDVASAVYAAHVHGAELDQRRLFPVAAGALRLPSYPWQRERFWFEMRIPDDLEHGFQGNVNTNSGNVNTDSGDVEHGFRDVEHRFRGT